ncbi:hypothetical protein TNCT_158191 [Trichonephila clavata]|uniref:Uncharacterized protein n=1 Tax=Trichonephila clavata TaxID=2740835 RepID=A0A8X6KRZ3_TRICU|nr:hypothetical protein TNCT_158191 [Trichonephila clavata]
MPKIAKKQRNTLNEKEIYGNRNASTLEENGKQEYTVKEHSQKPELFLKKSTFKIKGRKSKPSMKEKFRLNHITERSLSIYDPVANVTTKKKYYTSSKSHLLQNLPTQELSETTEKSILESEFSMKLSSTSSTLTESDGMKKLFSNNQTREELLINSTFESGNNNKIKKMYHIDDSNYAFHDLFPTDPSEGKTFVNSVAEIKYNEPLTKMDKYSQSYKVPKPFSVNINQTTGTITSTTASRYNAPMLKREGKIYSDYVLVRKKEKLVKSDKQPTESGYINKVEIKNDNQQEENPTESEFPSIHLKDKEKLPVDTTTENEDSGRKIKNKGKSETKDEYQLIYNTDSLAFDAFNPQVLHSTRESEYNAAKRKGNQSYITEENEENQNYSINELLPSSQQLEKFSGSPSNKKRYNSPAPKSMSETERDNAGEGLFSNIFDWEKVLLNSTAEIKYNVTMPESKESKQSYLNGLSSSSLKQEKWFLSTVESRYTTLNAQINESKPKLAVKKSRRKHGKRKNTLDISTVTARYQLPTGNNKEDNRNHPEKKSLSEELHQGNVFKNVTTESEYIISTPTTQVELDQEKWFLSMVESRYTTLNPQINESKPKLAVKKSRRKHGKRKITLDISTVTARYQLRTGNNKEDNRNHTEKKTLSEELHQGNVFKNVTESEYIISAPTTQLELDQEKWFLSTVESRYTSLNPQINESKRQLAVKKSRRKHGKRKSTLDISTVTARYQLPTGKQ